MVFPSATRLLSRQRRASTAELKWLREDLDQAHFVLDGYGVPRTSVAKGPNGKSVTLTLAGRLRLLVGDPPRRARHAASNRRRMTA